MQEPEAYIQLLPQRQRRIMEAIYEQLMLQPGVTCKMRFKIPFFYRNSWICYMNPQRSGGVELVFLKGRQLADPSGILDDKGRKMVSGVVLENAGNIWSDAMLELLQEALILDELDILKKSGKRNNK